MSKRYVPKRSVDIQTPEPPTAAARAVMAPALSPP
jgi:hypothetical protein